MTTSLLENIQQQLTPERIQYLSALVGETPFHTQKAVDGAISTLFVGLMHLSLSEDGPNQLLNLLNHDNYGRLLNNLSGLREQGNTAEILMAAGQDILSALFAGQLSTVNEVLATASDVASTSASSLLSLTAPVVVGVVERARAIQGLNAARLTKDLLDQKYVLSKQAPIGLAGVFGLSNVTDLGTELMGPETALAPNPARRMAVTPVREDSVLKKWLRLVLGPSQ